MRHLIKFLWPKHKLFLPPRVVISEYDLRHASRDEILIVESGRARSPQHARALMAKYQAISAGELLQKLPPRRRKGWKHRARVLARRMLGHDGDPMKKRSRDAGKLRANYRYKK